EAVGEGLGEHVGKLGGLFGLFEVGDQDVGKGFAPAAQEDGLLVLVERLDNDVADNVGEAGHAEGEVVGAGNVLGAVLQEVLEQLADGGAARFVGEGAVGGGDGGEAGDLAADAVGVPAKLDVVGEDEVG